MVYLDHAATGFRKPPSVGKAMLEAMAQCASPGRGGYPEAMEAAERVYACRCAAAELFDCQPEQAVLTMNCTHGLNLAIRTLVKPGARVVISGFEHNAVTRPLHALHAQVRVAGRSLFDRADTLQQFEAVLRRGVDAAVFTHVSNVFGYILPVEELAALCRRYGVPFLVDAAQSAGMLPVSLSRWGADFVAMPGHKGLLGPQGTGLLLCNRMPEPLLCGGTGSESIHQQMPDFLPDRAEAGTINVPGAAGLEAGMRYVNQIGTDAIFRRAHAEAMRCAANLRARGLRVFSGADQAATVSFVPEMDCEEAAQVLAQRGIAVRAGLHCAPLAHESAGTMDTGTVRVSYGHDATPAQTEALLRAVSTLR